MKNGIKLMFALSVGAAIGSVVTWKVIKTKYQQIAEEEIESVREYYETLYSEKESVIDVEPDQETPAEVSVSKADVRSLATRVSELGYNPEEEVEDVNGPYVISPEEFATLEDYETVELTYYANGVLTDDTDDPIEDIEGTVGSDFASHFGEFEDDSVHIRNEMRRTDYEILAVSRNYTDVTDEGRI